VNLTSETQRTDVVLAPWAYELVLT
jgi:hypothetical protein